jgi:hypothetical protein
MIDLTLGNMEMPGTSLLVEEVRTWNTPLIGAYQLWQFTLGFCDAHSEGDAPVGILHFIAAPILASPQLSESINQRRKNLQSYAFGFEDQKRIDVLLDLQARIEKRKNYTLASIDAAICSGLLLWDVDSGKLFPSQPPKARRGRSLRVDLRREGNKARLLGTWFAEHDLPTIATYLKLVL